MQFRFKRAQPMRLCPAGCLTSASAKNESWSTAGGPPKDCVCIVSSSLALLAACAWMVAGEGGTMMLENRAPRIFLGIFLAIFVVPALAHDPSHPELNGWFDKLASGRGLCCSLTVSPLPIPTGNRGTGVIASVSMASGSMFLMMP